MKQIVLPVLGGEGWVTDTANQISILMAQALVADYSQTTIYADSVTSIPYIVAQYQTDPLNMAIKLEDALMTYYKRYFTQVTVTVTYDDTPGITYPLYISIIVVDNGTSYSLANVASIDKGILTAVLREVNK